MQYDKTFKEEVVKLSDEIGLNAAANQLGVIVAQQDGSEVHDA